MDNIRIAIYIRLSMADEEVGRGKDESNSVVNQRSLIHRFLDKHEELSLYPRTEFVDDGFSGTNTDRPAYRKMIDQIKAGRYQVLITKDFSRANRNYIEMGDLIERLLPSLGVRYISINDGYDSNKYIGTTGGLDVVMRAIVYDAYSKDLSIKGKTARAIGRKKGRRVSGLPAYGYTKDPEHPAMDVIDPEAAAIVRRIFDYAIEGNSCADIARILNEEGVLTPSMYFKMKNPGTKKFKNVSPAIKWDRSNVASVLTHLTYTGAAVGGMTYQAAPCSKQTVRKAKEEWVIVPDMHEPIVSMEEYEQAQKVIQSHEGYGKSVPKDYPLKSLVVCGCCGRKLLRYQRVTARFRCQYSRKNLDTPCRRIHSPAETEMNEIVFQAIKQYMSLQEQSAQSKKMSKVLQNNSVSLQKLQETTAKLKQQKLKCYEKYAAGDLSKEDYLEQKRILDAGISETEKDIANWSDNLCEEEDGIHSEFEAACNVYKEQDVLTNEMAKAFIKEIIIDEDGSMNIVWRFEDIFAE